MNMTVIMNIRYRKQGSRYGRAPYPGGKVGAGHRIIIPASLNEMSQTSDLLTISWSNA